MTVRTLDSSPPHLPEGEDENGCIRCRASFLHSADHMICILHGYLLEGSGSNLWTRCIVESLCLEGYTVQLVCQEPYPERYDCIAEAHRYHPDGRVETMFTRDVPYAAG